MPMMSSDDRSLQCVMTPSRFPMVPDGTNSPAGFPNMDAQKFSSSITVGSSPKTSSPKSALTMAAFIAAVGCVTVSDRMSIRAMLAGGGSRHDATAAKEDKGHK